jgi:putative membrane protein
MKIVQYIVPVCLLVAGASFCPAARAQASDQTFATKAASGGMAEVKLGQLAQKNGSAPAVKEFGKRMETDHSKANDELKDAASKDNATLPSAPGRAEQATYDRLAKLSGPDFDKAYADDMVKDHEEDIAAFKKEASGGQSPNIKGFASKTLPTLQDHLKMARDMKASVAK